MKHAVDSQNQGEFISKKLKANELQCLVKYPQKYKKKVIWCHTSSIMVRCVQPKQ